MGQRKQNELEHLRMPEIQEALKKKKKKVGVSKDHKNQTEGAPKS